MVIDNLGDTRAQWDAISDNVMGGVSEVNFYELDDGANKFYRLEGLLVLQIMVDLFRPEPE